MTKYDGFLFGNGLTINLLSQLKQTIPNKQYLFNIDDFLKAWISNMLSFREEGRVFSVLYRKRNLDNEKFFGKVKTLITQYYDMHDESLEYSLGVDLFQDDCCGYDFPAIMTTFPALYNIWYELLYEYLVYLKRETEISNFLYSVKNYIESNNIFTTNFDGFANGLNPNHLHGSFIMPFRKYDDLYLKMIDEDTFLYKCIWGWNGIGKLSLIEQCRETPSYERYFDFDFFYNDDIHIKHLLIYGIGFQKSGFTEKITMIKPQYEKPVFGGIIDEHILCRLRALQTQNQLGQITFAYYTDKELHHYQSLTEYFNLEHVKYVNSSTFKFSIS